MILIGANRLFRKFGWILTSLFLAGTATGVILYKPIRILAPEAFGLTCVSETLCIDDVSRQDEIVELMANAASFVSSELSPLKTEPTVLFCSTRDCFAKFTNPTVAAQYFWGARTLLIGDRSTLYIIRHELIHHWQNENYGGPREALHLPMWFLEGTAYSLSEDPRDVIPNVEANAQRARFTEWLNTGGDWRTPPIQ